MKDERESEEQPCELGVRTKAFALRIIRLYCALPTTTEAQTIGRQILRSGTSVGAHYREARRAKSNADFINKMQGGLQELDETAYWLEPLFESGIVRLESLRLLGTEAEELTAIFVAVIKKVRRKQ